MAYELVYTSAPVGLTRGSSGFCVVACTKGLGPRLMVTLEGLSAYKPLYPHYAPNAWENPISRSHYLYEANGESQHILSRTCFNGVDHTQRSNKLASHLVLSKAETNTANGGPTSLLLLEELFKNAQWDIKAEYFPTQKTIPPTVVSCTKCVTWEKVMGDAGWGGYLAQLYVESPNKNVYIAYRPEQNDIVLSLLHETISLLPPTMRWQVTFNTYFVNLPAGMSCSWRCCPIDSDALRLARRSPSNIIIDITKPQSLNRDGELITLARTGNQNSSNSTQVITSENNPGLEKQVSKLPDEEDVKLLSQPDIEVENFKLSLKSHSTKQSSDCFSRENIDYIPSTPSHSSHPFLLIFSIILGVAILAGGSLYIVTNVKNKQLYAAQKTKCQTLQEELTTEVQNKRQDIERKKTGLQTENVANDLIDEVEELLQVVDSIKSEIEKLKKYQYLFEMYEANNRQTKKSNTPQGLIASCEEEKNSLEKCLSDLKKYKTDIIERNKKLAKVLDKEKLAKKQPIANASQEKVLSSTLQKKKKTIRPPKPVVKQSIEDARYLWKKSAELHRLDKGKKIEISVGNCRKDELVLIILPYIRNVHKIGLNFSCVDNFDRQIEFKTEFNTGKIIIIQNSVHRLPKNSEFLLRVKGNDYPLFFRLDISKIKVKDYNKGEITFNGTEISVKIPSSSLHLPEDYYDPENGLCKVRPSLNINISQKTYELKDYQAPYYIAKWKDNELEKINSKLSQLKSMEKNFFDSIEKYLSKIPEGKLKKQIRAFKEQNKKYESVINIITNEDTIVAIAKAVGDKQSKPKPEQLKKKLDELKDTKKKDIEKKYKKWFDAFEKKKEIENEYIKAKKKLVDAIKKEIPLDKFEKKYSRRSLDEEKTVEEKKFKQRKEELVQQVKAGKLQLCYADKAYDQLKIKELIK